VTKTTTIPKVAIYTRLSQDRDGQKTSTTRQEQDCLALAQARGWKVAAVFKDSDRSAYSGKERPAFDAMIGAIDRGDVQGVVAWKVDRLGRRTAEVVTLIGRVNKRGGFLATCDGLDSSTPVGKSVMQIASVFAEMESDANSTRTTRAKLQAARDGRPSGGGRRPFGYKAGGLELMAREVHHIREAVTEILAGGSLRTIVRRWNDKGVRTSEGNAWQPASLRRLLMGGRIAGLRYYQGELMGEAIWPAIIERTQHERLRAILGDPRRRTSKPTARTYLLTGFLVCGRCGESLVGGRRPDDVRTYVCRAQQRGTGCGGVRIVADPLEALIVEAVLQRLDSPQLAKMRAKASKTDTSAKLVRQLREDEVSLEQLVHDHYVERLISRADFIVASDALSLRIAQAGQAFAEQASAGVVSALPGAGKKLRADWEGADLDRRRAIIGAIVESITIAPIGRGKRSGPDRVGVRWLA
jgi:DNA invertase Pin-like site-specific DNA recombinase